MFFTITLILFAAGIASPALADQGASNTTLNETPVATTQVPSTTATVPPETVTPTTVATTGPTTIPTSVPTTTMAEPASVLPTQSLANITNTTVTTPALPEATNISTVTTTPAVNATAREPVIKLDTPIIQNETVYLDGSAMAGTPGVSITSISWDWGDGTYENGAFPMSHRYAKPGTYLVTVSVHQSNGLSTQGAAVVVISPAVQATATPTPFSPNITTITPVTVETTPITLLPQENTTHAVWTVPPPVINLSEPSVQGLTVVISGEVRSGSASETISRISWSWGDNTTSENLTLPVMHTYPAPGTYTLHIVVTQSDGQRREREIVFTLTMPGPEGPPPPGRNGPGPDLVLIGAVLVVAGLVIGIAVTLGHRRLGGESNAAITLAIRRAVDAYQVAREHGDVPAARVNAEECARLLRKMALKRPSLKMRYIEKAEIWDAVARSVGSQEEKTRPPASREARAAFDTMALLEDDYDDIIAGTDVDPAVLSAVVRVAREIAREGREGKPIGTAFVIGDTEAVMARSKQFVLNPFKGHEAEERNIVDPATWENVKEFSLLDGAFIIAGDGTIEAAGRYITVDTSKVRIPKGLGSRHASIAGITLATRAIGVVVSQSGGVVKIFRNGEIRRTYRS